MNTIEAVALRGTLRLSYEGRNVDINLDGLTLNEVLEYVERKTGVKVSLIAGQTVTLPTPEPITPRYVDTDTLYHAEKKRWLAAETRDGEGTTMEQAVRYPEGHIVRSARGWAYHLQPRGGGLFKLVPKPQ